MRAYRLAMVTLLVATGLATGAPSAYADVTGSLGVSPNHGSPDAPFTVTLRWQSSRHGKNRVCAPAQVTFDWDGSPLGSAAAVPAGGACVASLQAAPPPGTYDGVSTHTISVGGIRGARTAYRVVAGAAASQPSTDTATPDNSPAPSAEAPTDTPTGPAGVANTNPSAQAAANSSGGTGLSGFTLAAITFGVLLFLAGAGIIGAMVWRGRRAQQAADARVPEVVSQTPGPASDPFLTATRPLHLPQQVGRQQEPETIQLPPIQPGA